MPSSPAVHSTTRRPPTPAPRRCGTRWTSGSSATQPGRRASAASSSTGGAKTAASATPANQSSVSQRLRAVAASATSASCTIRFGPFTSKLPVARLIRRMPWAPNATRRQSRRSPDPLTRVRARRSSHQSVDHPGSSPISGWLRSLPTEINRIADSGAGLARGRPQRGPSFCAFRVSGRGCAYGRRWRA